MDDGWEGDGEWCYIINALVVCEQCTGVSFRCVSIYHLHPYTRNSLYSLHPTVVHQYFISLLMLCQTLACRAEIGLRITRTDPLCHFTPQQGTKG